MPCLTSGTAQQPAGGGTKTGRRRSSPPPRGLGWDGGIVSRVEVLAPCGPVGGPGVPISTALQGTLACTLIWFSIFSQLLGMT